MRYVIVPLIALLAAFGLYSADVTAWDAPEECADEERENPNNRLSPCRSVTPEVSHVEHRVRMEYPVCIEEMVFHMPGSVAPDASVRLQVYYQYRRNETRELEWEFHKVYDGYVVFGPYRTYADRWHSKSNIPTASGFGNPAAGNTLIWLRTPYDGFLDGNTVDRPRTDALSELIYACLALVQQEKEDQAHTAAVEQAETEAAARIAAEQDASEKAEEQAQRDAESQARIAAQELTAAQESKRRAAATELVKTQTLQAQIAHEEVIASILRDIVRIRLAGQEDRARITNEYLTRAETEAAAFEGETSEVEARIQAYLDFNAALLTRLEEYQADIGARLERVQASIEEQQANIDRLAEEAQERLAGTEEDAATPVPEPEEPGLSTNQELEEG